MAGMAKENINHQRIMRNRKAAAAAAS